MSSGLSNIDEIVDELEIVAAGLIAGFLNGNLSNMPEEIDEEAEAEEAAS